MGVNKTNRKRYLFEGVEYLSKNGKEITEYVHSNWNVKLDISRTLVKRLYIGQKSTFWLKILNQNSKN